MEMEVSPSSLRSPDEVIMMSIKHLRWTIFSIGLFSVCGVIFHCFKFETNDTSLFLENYSECNSVCDYNIMFRCIILLNIKLISVNV